MRNNLAFNQYHFLLVRTGRIWCFDCGSWDKDTVRAAQIADKRDNPKSQSIMCTSPSDDDTVIQRIIKAYNR